MEPKTSLVRSKSGIELQLPHDAGGGYLNSIAAVDFHFSLIIFPHDAELNDSFRDSNDTDNFLQFGMFLEKSATFKCRYNFIPCLSRR
jgi:hypothetical protein